MNKIKSLTKMIPLSIMRILNAFRYSFDGFKAAFKSEAAFRQDLFIVIVLTPIAFIIKATTAERAWLLFSLLFILFAECINTAVETLTNRISPDIHPLSKKAKDIGSLIVFFAFANTIIVWLLVLL